MIRRFLRRAHASEGVQRKLHSVHIFGHLTYFAAVATTAHGPYAYVAGALLLVIIAEHVLGDGDA